jgi:hypothetical protein
MALSPFGKRIVNLKKFHLDAQYKPVECYGICSLPKGTTHAYFESGEHARRWSHLQGFSPEQASKRTDSVEIRYTEESFNKLTLTEEQEARLSVEALYDHRMRQLVPQASFLYYEPATDHREARVKFTNVKDRHLKTITQLSEYPAIEAFMLYNDGAGITVDGIQTFELMTNEDILAELQEKPEIEQINPIYDELTQDSRKN